MWKGCKAWKRGGSSASEVGGMLSEIMFRGLGIEKFGKERPVLTPFSQELTGLSGVD